MVSDLTFAAAVAAGVAVGSAVTWWWLRKPAPGASAGVTHTHVSSHGNLGGARPPPDSNTGPDAALAAVQRVAEEDLAPQRGLGEPLSITSDVVLTMARAVGAPVYIDEDDASWDPPDKTLYMRVTVAEYGHAGCKEEEIVGVSVYGDRAPPAVLPSVRRSANPPPLMRVIKTDVYLRRK